MLLAKVMPSETDGIGRRSGDTTGKKTRRLLFPHLESHDMMELDRYA
jgi:hypothetical protein